MNTKWHFWCDMDSFHLLPKGQRGSECYLSRALAGWYLKVSLATGEKPEYWPVADVFFSVKATLWDPQILSRWFISGWISAKGSWCFAVPLDPRFSPRQVAGEWCIRKLEMGKTADPSSSCCPSRLWFGPGCSAATSACWFCIPWLLWKIPLNLQLQNPWLLCAICRFYELHGENLLAKRRVSKWRAMSLPLLNSLKKFSFAAWSVLLPWVQFNVSLEVSVDRHSLGHCIICGSDLSPGS